MGLAFARGCAEIGGNVAVLDILESPSPGLSLIEKETGVKVQYYRYGLACWHRMDQKLTWRLGRARVDIADFQALQKVFAQVKNDFGSIDSLVNAAGIGVGGPLVDSSQEDIRKTLDVNVRERHEGQSGNRLTIVRW